MDALSNKKYWDIPGNSPELVVCFLPAESILAAALSADPALLDYALSRNVVLASPSTLLAVLKSVAFTWRQDVLTDSARELFELAHQLYERMGTLGENVTKLGASSRHPWTATTPWWARWRPGCCRRPGSSTPWTRPGWPPPRPSR